MRTITWTSSAILVALAATIVVHVRTGGANNARSGQTPAPVAASPTPGASTVANPHGELRVACEVCHTAESWNVLRAGGGFDHATTGFPLAGGHRSASCGSCHKSLEFARVATSCADCHRDVHEGKNGFRCQDCHAGDHWAARSDAVRLHAASGFTLRGAHALVECSRCHAGDARTHVAATSRECIACHAADYAAASSPNHAAAGYSTSCSDCHNAGGITWSGAGFDHASTGFSLTGAHRAQACTACHGGGTYAGLSRDCFACHQAAYDATRNPAHRAAGFGTACATCHSTTTWSGATFDHASTGFPLTGAHRAQACTACHSGGVYAGLSPDCVACHQADYDGASPDHRAAGFGTACATCHSTTTWSGATFDHASTGFPLTGAHRTQACNACHSGGVYTGLSPDCVACHQADYDGASPDHRAAGFGTTCATCHSTTTWSGATFDHDARYFRIYSGAHREKWTSCTQCHTSQADYRVFNCLSCHGQTETDNKHREVTGYRYESNACYNCHRRV